MTGPLPRSVVRGYWAATGLLLLAGVTVAPVALVGAVALTMLQVLHVCARGQTIADLPVQVRIVFLALLVAGLWPPLGFLHVIQCVGVTANVLVDYCLLARLLSLAPWNRREPLRWPLVRWTLSVPPGPGSIANAGRASGKARKVGRRSRE